MPRAVRSFDGDREGRKAPDDERFDTVSQTDLWIFQVASAYRLLPLSLPKALTMTNSECLSLLWSLLKLLER